MLFHENNTTLTPKNEPTDSHCCGFNGGKVGAGCGFLNPSARSELDQFIHGQCVFQ